MTEPTTEQVAEAIHRADHGASCWCDYSNRITDFAAAVQDLYAPVLAERVTHDRLTVALHQVRDPCEHSVGVSAAECLYCPELARDVLAALAGPDGKDSDD